jgi:hypothetical protein
MTDPQRGCRGRLDRRTVRARADVVHNNDQRFREVAMGRKG